MARGCTAFLTALAGVSVLGAQGIPWEAFGGARLQLSEALPVGSPSLGSDTRGHLGSGVGIFFAGRASARHAFRGALDYVGTEVATWYTTFPNQADRIEYKDIWRSLRLSIEHEFTLSERRGVYLLWGGGVEESWVNRTEGDLLQVTLLGWAWSQGATSGSARTSTKSTALEDKHAFFSAGLGWRARSARRGWGDLELRLLTAPYRRYTATGLRTHTEGPTERVVGHRVVLSWAVRMGE